jgi:hypothetical protein
LLGYAIRTADPLAAITERANALNAMGALEGWDEKVPWIVGDCRHDIMSTDRK